MQDCTAASFFEETDCDVKMKLGIKSVVNLIGGLKMCLTSF